MCTVKSGSTPLFSLCIWFSSPLYPASVQPQLNIMLALCLHSSRRKTNRWTHTYAHIYSDLLNQRQESKVDEKQMGPKLECWPACVSAKMIRTDMPFFLVGIWSLMLESVLYLKENNVMFLKRFPKSFIHVASFWLICWCATRGNHLFKKVIDFSEQKTPTAARLSVPPCFENSGLSADVGIHRSIWSEVAKWVKLLSPVTGARRQLDVARLVTTPDLGRSSVSMPLQVSEFRIVGPSYNGPCW